MAKTKLTSFCTELYLSAFNPFKARSQCVEPINPCYSSIWRSGSTQCFGLYSLTLTQEPAQAVAKSGLVQKLPFTKKRNLTRATWLRYNFPETLHKKTPLCNSSCSQGEPQFYPCNSSKSPTKGLV